MKIFEILEGYYKHRGYAMPDANQALLFLCSEIGELCEAHVKSADMDDETYTMLMKFKELGLEADDLVSSQGEFKRNNNRQGKTNIGDEIGDVYQMLEVYTIQQFKDGSNAMDCLKTKMGKYGYKNDNQ